MANHTYESVVETLKTKLQTESKITKDLTDATNVLELGLDSLDVMSYIFYIEETYDLKIDDDKLEDNNFMIIGETANYILANLP